MIGRAIRRLSFLAHRRWASPEGAGRAIMAAFTIATTGI